MSQEQSIKPHVNGTAKAERPDPEVVPRLKRRQFTAVDKLRILDEVERCEPGQIGAVLRREGLYSSHLSKWRQLQAKGQLQGLSPRKRGRKPDPQAAELVRLRRENDRLKARLEQAETIIEVQKKLCQLLGLPTAETQPSETD